MMTSNLYICAFESKLTHKEATTRDWELKGRYIGVKGSKSCKKIEELAKCAMLDKRVAKKLFDERWSTKCCV